MAESEEKFEDCSFRLLDMKYDPADADLNLKVDMIPNSNPEDASCQYMYFACELTEMSVQSKAWNPQDQQEWDSAPGRGLPEGYPEENLTYRELCRFVQKTFIPRDGEEIGEAEIRMNMDAWKNSREDAVKMIRWTRKMMRNERDNPSASSLRLIVGMARKQGVELTMKMDADGYWSIDLETPNPAHRLRTGKEMFSSVCMAAIFHLKKMEHAE
jgi:hypothetical protein